MNSHESNEINFMGNVLTGSGRPYDKANVHTNRQLQ